MNKTKEFIKEYKHPILYTLAIIYLILLFNYIVTLESTSLWLLIPHLIAVVALVYVFFGSIVIVGVSSIWFLNKIMETVRK